MRISGAFGVRGLVRVFLFSDNVKSYSCIYDENGKEFEFKIIRYIKGNNVVLSIDGITTRSSAELLRGSFLYANKDDLDVASEDEFYVCDLIGMQIKVVDNCEECTVLNVYNFGAGDILELSHNDGIFMVPFTKQHFPANNGSICITSDAFCTYKN
jgi:16S rRNA processing protein RimM